ncbi:MAG TPA: hypothetical protein VGO07_07475, partial [Candidatus Saccharimonadales bacterium]|nr:hypothetical protein [Candidatus Saccharimonadales bacterium]
MTAATMEAPQYVLFDDAVRFARLLALSRMVTPAGGVDQYLAHAAEPEPAPDHTPQHASPEPGESTQDPQYEQSRWFATDGPGQKYDPDQTDPTIPIVLGPPPTNPAGKGS